MSAITLQSALRILWRRRHNPISRAMVHRTIAALRVAS